MRVEARPSDLVGGTPLIDLSSLVPNHNATLLGKMESLEPCSSVKDRLGKSMIDQAEKDGLLIPGKSVLVEATSGNTGIALAFIARERGYRCILTMPETMSVERRMMLLALGGEVVLTPKETMVHGALAKANEILQESGEKGPETWRDTDGTIDIFVAGVGTGGTVTGVSQYIKGCTEFDCPPLMPELYTVAVEPQEQMLITEARGGTKIGPQGPHRIQGIGAGLVPEVLDIDLLDEVVAVHSSKAEEMTLKLWMMGLPTGVSSGAIVEAAVQVCSRPENKDKIAVCIIPSFGERYFTHPMFAQTKTKAEALTKQPLPEPFDNTEFGFATSRG
ncbi:hypothetical protein FisN_11Hu166 [Fistulifera solaris]|uniref:Tryptophan synthase beta chain-like PALP domain-containing protein n=1 Tax=Fistulifera solaris TaxID=1519565 RepID=A0A1Z5JKE4_FISSO|nr:hypothetical protein FisN_11Hu166 [Fistulifera solaris]|eukprot:GAX14376.1 hypothetical protein FisN_11Hu166 [Fistulifera solaris]